MLRSTTATTTSTLKFQVATSTGRINGSVLALSSTVVAGPIKSSRRALSTLARTRTVPTGAQFTASPARHRLSASTSSKSVHPAQQRAFHSSTPRSGEKKRETFKLADIGEGITECEVIKWSIKPGSQIQAFDPLCEVQSDKASVEITSPFDGIVHEILVKEGDIAKVGAGLCIIEVDEEATDTHSPQSSTQATQEPSSAQSQAPELAEQQPPRRGMHPLDPSNSKPRLLHELRIGTHPSIGKSLFAKNKLSTFDPDTPASSDLTGSSEARLNENPDVLAPPSVRHLAKLSGVDLARVSGTGKDGRIGKGDLEAYLAGVTSGVEASQTSATRTTKEEARKIAQEDVVVELGRTRHNMWKAMVKSLEIPHFGYSTTLDITELHDLLPTLNANIPTQYLPPSIADQRQPLAVKAGMANPSAIYPAPSSSFDLPESQQYAKLTYLPILLKTLSKAMMHWPLLRSSITPVSSAASDQPPKPTLTVRPHADIALALSTPTGLYTPTLAAVDSSSIYSLASSLKHLSHLGRQTPCALTPKEMPKRGGTVTVSNVGAVGKGEGASPVLVPGGGVAIVALGRAKWVWDVDSNPNGEGERRLKLNVSWSADHRVVEGAELAAFVECWRGYVEDPVRLIGEGV